MSDVVWPMGMERDLSTRPMVFNPEGFLVAILNNTEACERARTALLEAGFSDGDLRIYTSQQILEDHEIFLKRARRRDGWLVPSQTISRRSISTLGMRKRGEEPFGSTSQRSLTPTGPRAA